MKKIILVILTMINMFMFAVAVTAVVGIIVVSPQTCILLLSLMLFLRLLIMQVKRQ
jgi:hypothetical protein